MELPSLPTPLCTDLTLSNATLSDTIFMTDGTVIDHRAVISTTVMTQ